jgi:hypothetical protein
MAANDVSTLVEQLKKYLASLGSASSCTSEDEKANHFAAYSTTQGLISQLMNPPDHKRVAALEERRAARDAWLQKEKELVDEISCFKDWRLAGTVRERDDEYSRQSVLRHQLKRLRDGSLYVSPGRTVGTLDALDARVAELEVRVGREQAAFDAAAKQAEQLLGAATSSK